MNNLKNILPITALAFFIIVISSLFILSLNGYELDVVSREVTKNGIISIDSQPDNASVELDEVLLNEQTGLNIDIEEGAHNIRVFKEGFLSWDNIAIVEHSKVVSFDYPLLIPLNLVEEKLLSTTNVVNSFHDEDDEVVYFVTRERDDEGVYFLSLSSYSLEQGAFVFRDYVLNIDDTTLDDNVLNLKPAVVDATNGLVLLELTNSEDKSTILGFDSKQPGLVFPISDNYTKNISDIFFIDDDSIMMFSAESDLVTLNDWATESPLLSGVSENVKTFSVTKDSGIVLQLNDSKDIQLLEFDENVVSSITLPNISGNYKAVYIHNHSGEDNIILETTQTLASYNLARVSSSPAPIDPTWSTTLDETTMSSSDNNRFISFTNGEKIFTYDYQANQSTVAQLNLFIEPDSVRWTNDFYFTAKAQNEESILVSDYDGENQVALTPKKLINHVIGMNEPRTSILFLDENNSISIYNLTSEDQS